MIYFNLCLKQTSHDNHITVDTIKLYSQNKMQSTSRTSRPAELKRLKLLTGQTDDDGLFDKRGVSRGLEVNRNSSDSQ